MKLKDYQISKELIVRAPKLNLNSSVINFNNDLVLNILPQIEDALFLSSLSLSERLRKYEHLNRKEKENVNLSLYKYYSRMCTRATPFGLFSGIYKAEWGDTSKIKIEKEFKTIISLDGNVLNKLFLELRTHLEFLDEVYVYKNDTFQIKKKVLSLIQKKFTEYSKYSYSFKEFSAGKEDAIKEIFDFIENEKKIVEVVKFIIENGYTKEESYGFLAQLIQENILTTSIDPIPDANKYFHFLFSHLRGNPLIIKLYPLYKRIQELNKSKNITIHELNRLKVEILNFFPELKEEKDLIKVDYNGSYTQSLIPQKFKNNIAEAFEILTKISQNKENQNIRDFKKEFLKNYEDNFIPILDLFDPIKGIRFLGNIKHADTPLLNESIFGKRNNQQSFFLSKNEVILLNLFCNALQNNEKEILLDDVFFESSQYSFSDSFQAKFSILDSKTISFDNFKGNASFLLSRFNDNPDVNEVQNKIIQEENKINHEKILAEVIHIPEVSKAFNIINNSEIRNCIIPIVGNSYYFREKNVINLSDIQVSVRENRIILYSEIHQKEIIPRLTSGVDHRNVSNLPLYRFLGDISHDANKSLTFKWPYLLFSIKPKFIPRVRYKTVILSPSIWIIGKKDLDLNSGFANFNRSLTNFRNFNKVMPYVLIRRGDNKLFLNLDNLQLSYKILRKEFMKSEVVELEEYLFKSSSVESNEIFAFFTKIAEEKKMQKKISINKTNENIFFSPLSSWTTFQIYLNEEYLEKIISSSLFNEVISALINQKIIKLWFFVRYKDETGVHLRLRFKINDIEKNSSQVYYIISNYLNSIGILNYKMAPYIRETYRYKGKVEDSELLFYHQSVLVIKILEIVNIRKDESFRWIISIKLIDILFNQFEATEQEKIDITTQLKDDFNKEFAINREGFKDFNRKYTDCKKEINEVIQDFKDIEISEFFSCYFSNSHKTVYRLKKALRKKNRNEILKSYIHMLLNKIFIILPRHHEVYIYNIMNRYYIERKFKHISTKNVD